jgi:hypothetical protein
MMNQNKIQKGKVCICVKPVHILFIFLIVVSVAVILLLPQGTRFQGALIQPQTQQQEQEIGTVVVEYVKDADEVRVEVGSENVILGRLGFQVKNEPVEITAITMELEGNTNNESFEGLSLKDYENIDFVWLSSSKLLIDLSANPLIIDEYFEVTLQTKSLNVDNGSSSAFHFIDAVATGLKTGEIVTSLGINGALDPMPQVNKYF